MWTPQGRRGVAPLVAAAVQGRAWQCAGATADAAEGAAGLQGRLRPLGRAEVADQGRGRGSLKGALGEIALGIKPVPIHALGLGDFAC